MTDVMTYDVPAPTEHQQQRGMRCETCKHWTAPNHFSEHGRCREIKVGWVLRTDHPKEPAFGATNAHCAEGFFTKSDFGCVQWKARE